MALRLVAFIATLSLLFVPAKLPAQTQPAVQPAAATANAAPISGFIYDQNGGLPIARARLQLQRNGNTVATAVTDAYGGFSFRTVPLGTYTILVQAPGYQSGRSEAIVVSGPASVNVALVRAGATGGLRTIANVRSGGVGALQTTTTIQNSVDVNVVKQTNQTRIAESLAKIPGVNAADADSSRGDDIGIDIRGLKPSETQILLDSHPIGPLGVYPGWDVGGGSGAFDLADSPVFALKSAEITYGSGADGALWC